MMEMPNHRGGQKTLFEPYCKEALVSDGISKIHVIAVITYKSPGRPPQQIQV